MTITLNGRSHTIAESASLQKLIEQFCRDTRHVIAEVNGAIVKNPQWPQRRLQPGDTVELINFVGGG